MDKDDIQIEIQVIASALTELKKEYERGRYDIGRYLLLKTDYERQKAALEIQLIDVTAPPRKDQAPGVAPEDQASTHRYKLRSILWNHFSEGELRDLCYFELNIDYESLPGPGKGDKIRGLILYCERFGRTDELEQACRRLRPHAFT